MAGLERYQDVGIHGSDRRRIAIGHVDGAVRKPDVVDDAGYFRFRNRFADGAFDQVPQSRGLFDARSSLGAKMQIELTGVGGREKVAAEPGKQQKGGGAQRKKGRNEESPPADAGFERPEITHAHSFKTALKNSLETAGEVPGFRLCVLLVRS